MSEFEEGVQAKMDVVLEEGGGRCRTAESTKPAASSPKNSFGVRPRPSDQDRPYRAGREI